MLRSIVALSVLCLVSGQSNGLEDKIVGGKTVSISELPVQVSLQLFGEHFCGGSILNNYWILTAAHCLDKIILNNLVDYLKIRAGSTNYKSGGVSKKAAMVEIHPYYQTQTKEYDVGVIKLAQPLVYSSSIKPVALATTLPPANTQVVVSGWGKTSDNNNVLPTNLLKVDLEFIPTDICGSPMFNYAPGAIKDSMICTTGDAKDSCQGDSGGPLMIPDTNPIIQIGIVSWGAGCAEVGKPGAYCDLTNNVVLNFLRSATGLLL